MGEEGFSGGSVSIISITPNELLVMSVITTKRFWPVSRFEELSTERLANRRPSDPGGELAAMED